MYNVDNMGITHGKTGQLPAHAPVAAVSTNGDCGHNDVDNVVRCRNTNTHNREGLLGNILCVVKGSNIYIQCSDRGCSRWTRLTFKGLDVSLSECGISQQVMPRDFRFRPHPAAVVVQGDA